MFSRKIASDSFGRSYSEEILNEIWLIPGS